jgi:adenosine deaminase
MMSVETYVQAMPKVELNLRLEGGISPATLLMIAEHNEVFESPDEWAERLDSITPENLHATVHEISSWVQQPDDLTRVVYDLGVSLAKQNIRYAEVNINPSLYTALDIPTEAFFEAANDGRERAERAWNVKMAWILAIPREEPRRSDEFARWAALVTARRNHVVALGLTGDESAQPIGQFERAFRSAEKKEVARVPHAGDVLGAEGVLEAINTLAPVRLADAWGAWESEDAMKLVDEGGITLDLSPAEGIFAGKIESYADFPLRLLLDAGVSVTVGTDMPTVYGVTLSELYQAVVDDCGLTLEELDELALNAVQMSLQADEDKEAMLETFRQEYADLREQHMAAEVEAETDEAE